MIKLLFSLNIRFNDEQLMMKSLASNFVNQPMISWCFNILYQHWKIIYSWVFISKVFIS